MGVNQRLAKRYLQEHDVIKPRMSVIVLVRFDFYNRDELGVFLFIDIVST